MRGDRPFLLSRLAGVLWFTPHARGSTESVKLFPWFFRVYPACAGIDLYMKMDISTANSLPRMRGDRPREYQHCHDLPLFTPHARGSTAVASAVQEHGVVYPACAGIDLCFGPVRILGFGLPRMRGDRPYTDPVDRKAYLFTPHARGSTPKDDFLRVFLIVYPACAGIDLVPGQVSERLHRLPRMRGDRPILIFLDTHDYQFTPHARGSTPRSDL